MSTTHTQGPWRWEINMQSKRLHLVGGRPQFDLTIMDFERWGMGNATISLRDTAHDGMNLMHKLHERPDWIAPFPGREHHKSWIQNVIHPDARLIAAAPDLLRLLIECRATLDMWKDVAPAVSLCSDIDTAISKATGAAT